MSTRWFFVATYAAMVLAVTLAPITTPATSNTGVDKLVHALLFGGLVYLLVRRTVWTPARYVAAVTATAVFAGLIEVLQDQLPYRAGELYDLVAGVVGAAVGGTVGAGRRGTPRP